MSGLEGTICGTGHQTWASCMQVKLPTHCAFSPAPSYRSFEELVTVVSATKRWRYPSGFRGRKRDKNKHRGTGCTISPSRPPFLPLCGVSLTSSGLGGSFPSSAQWARGHSQQCSVTPLGWAVQYLSPVMQCCCSLQCSGDRVPCSGFRGPGGVED